MFQINILTFIQRNHEDVFRYLCNTKTIPDWSTGIHHAEADPPGDLQAGSRLREYGTFFGKPQVTEWEVTVFEPGCRIVLETSTLMTAWAKMDFVLKPRNGGTDLECSLFAEGKGLLRFLEKPLGTRLESIRKMELACIKTNLEKDLVEFPD